MDYRKIFLYLIIVLVAFWYWHSSEREEKARLAEFDRFVSVYAGTSVMAELYRNEPHRFYQSRDSIYAIYNYNADAVEQFESSFKDQEEEWVAVWEAIKLKTDSLIEYFNNNPVEHDPPDSSDTAGVQSK